MERFSCWLIVLLTFGTFLRANAADAAPKPGRYKGTFTIQATLIDPATYAETKAVVKKVIVVAGVLEGSNLQLVFAEKPVLPNVVHVVGTGTVEGNSLLLDIGFPVSLSGSKLTSGSIKGSANVTFGGNDDPFFNSSVVSQCKLSIALTRVGN